MEIPPSTSSVSPRGMEGTPRHRVLSQAAHDELQQRQTYTLHGMLKPERKGRMFEYFVVTGLPPSQVVSSSITPLHSPQAAHRFPGSPSVSRNHTYHQPTTTYNPEILFCYPPNQNANKHLVTHFSFPEGMSDNNVRRVATEIEMNELVFAPLSSVEESNSSFVFLLTAEEGLLYGVCVVHEELVREDLTFATRKEKDAVTAPDDVGYVVAPRCYMFLTKFPFFSTHFQVLYSILAQERTSRMFRKMAADMSSGDAAAPEVPDCEVVKLLERYYAFGVPQGEAKLEIALEHEQLEFEIPAGDEDEQLIGFCLAALLKLLPLEQILQLLNAILQEYQVIIISRQVSIISALVMGIIPLMRPYVWQGTFIPVVPASLEECVHSPMPYIMGIQHLSEESLEILEEDVLILDVDELSVLKCPSDMQPLPHHASLYKLLEPLHAQLYRTTPAQRSACYLQPYSNTPEEIGICNGILSVLRQYHKDIHHIILKGIRTIRQFDLSKPRHLTKLLVAIGDEISGAFLKKFLSTQHWHFFFDKIQHDNDDIFRFNRFKHVSVPSSDTQGSEEATNSSDENSAVYSTADELDTALKQSGSQVIASIADAFAAGSDEDDDL